MNLNKSQTEAGMKSLAAHIDGLEPGQSYAIAEKMGDGSKAHEIAETLERLSNRARSAMHRAKHARGAKHAQGVEYQGEQGTYRTAKTHDTICVFTITRTA